MVESSEDQGENMYADFGNRGRMIAERCSKTLWFNPKANGHNGVSARMIYILGLEKGPRPTIPVLQYSSGQPRMILLRRRVWGKFKLK